VVRTWAQRDRALSSGKTPLPSGGTLVHKVAPIGGEGSCRGNVRLAANEQGKRGKRGGVHRAQTKKQSGGGAMTIS